jgi:sec-independent protein translocase protein TatA
MDIGPAELLIVLAVVLLLFGSKKLPELARGMGQASKEFRKGLHLGADDETDTTVSTTASEATPPEPPADPSA